MLRRAQDAVAAKRFVQTPSLEAHVRKRNLRDALHITADVADAMVFLHSMDIIHGRLTPSAPCVFATLSYMRLTLLALCMHNADPLPRHALCASCPVGLLPCAPALQLAWLCVLRLTAIHHALLVWQCRQLLMQLAVLHADTGIHLQ